MKVVAFIFCFLIVVPAHSAIDPTPQSPPLPIDDPGTPGSNQWEINILTDADITTDQRVWELPLMDLNYGVGDNLQLKYEIPYLAGSGAPAIGDSNLGVKYEFFDDEVNHTAIAIYPQHEFDTVNSPGSITTLPLLISMKIGETNLGDVMLTADLGYNISTKPDVVDFISASLGVGLPIMPRVALMGELASQSAIRDDANGVHEQLLRTDIALMGSLNPHLNVFGSVGKSLISSDSLGHFYLLIGIQILTGWG